MLTIVSAKDVKEAYKNSVIDKKKESFVIEEKGLQDFFYYLRDKFKFYEIYHKFEPYGISIIENSEIMYLREFAESVELLIDNNFEYENEVIQRFNLSKSKIKKYIMRFKMLLEYAKNNNDNLIGLGD